MRPPIIESPPATAPAPYRAMIRPQPRAPPRRSCATTGPSTRNGAHTSRLNRVNCSVVTQSQVLERNCSHPSRTAPVFGAEATRAETRSRVRASRLTAYVPASSATTTPDPATATRTPAIAGPPTDAIDCASPASALASRSLPSYGVPPAATAGIRAPRAGA